jgi:hypothetical protein
MYIDDGKTDISDIVIKAGVVRKYGIKSCWLHPANDWSKRV